MENEFNFLGVGWKFPPAFDEEQGTPILSKHLTDIKESLHILLNTKPGERVIFTEYGCNLREFNFRNINGPLLEQIRQKIKKAVKRFESRIELDEVNFNTKGVLEGTLLISLEYTVLMSNQKDNLVFPYYVESIRNEI
ncbi:GPW/gp25 family protein [Aureibacter tunicatorum]|uniref:IraD/Gp25-like domain-containing protein n=1 Tax=Aureibacter tunicatorum TaxID=866807 RepID=A0AAE3XJA7_9BACT|nr:GPW/gp25 family protein [Aureibacter tunicatorum]MDR6237440.1 hypothetical protein [Aureibacter tunicatorum]BDD06430.1 baseplate protein [Aureibacter tunicatorum]